MVIVIPVTGVLIAIAVAFYNVGGERRDLWLRARNRSLKFCEGLADVCDGILAGKSGPRPGSLPPVRTSLLLYLRKGLQEDLRRQLLAAHMFGGFSMQPYAIDDLAHQISDTCVRLHFAWERVTGIRIKDGYSGYKPEYLEYLATAEGYLDKASFLRERVTLLHWQIASQQLVTRRRAIITLIFGHTPVRNWGWFKQRVAPDLEEKSMSVNRLLG